VLSKGEKMSKSKGNAVAPADLVAKFGSDAFRYYFLRDVQFGADGSISMESMVQRYNGDLANDWGNLVSRVLNMTEKYCDGAVPAAPGARPPTDDDLDLRRIAEALPMEYDARMSRLDYAGALEATWELVKRANRYVEDAAPWNLAKSQETTERLHAVLFNALEAVRIVALFTAPVMPRTSAEVWRRLGLGSVQDSTDIVGRAAWGGMLMGEHVVKGDALFPRIYEEG
jgi:methionyl-tRNA synthetase